MTADEIFMTLQRLRFYLANFIYGMIMMSIIKVIQATKIVIFRFIDAKLLDLLINNDF